MGQIDKKLMTAIMAVVLALAVLYCAAISNDKKLLTQVKSGEKHLLCNFKDSERFVDPEKIVGFSDDTWVFENGYAKNCILK